MGLSGCLPPTCPRRPLLAGTRFAMLDTPHELLKAAARPTAASSQQRQVGTTCHAITHERHLSRRQVSTTTHQVNELEKNSHTEFERKTDRNQPFRRNIQKQRLQTSDQNLTKKPQGVAGYRRQFMTHTCFFWVEWLSRQVQL